MRHSRHGKSEPPAKKRAAKAARDKGKRSDTARHGRVVRSSTASQGRAAAPTRHGGPETGATSRAARTTTARQRSRQHPHGASHNDARNHGINRNDEQPRPPYHVNHTI